MTPSGTPEVLGRRRHRAVALLAERHSLVEVARMVSVDRCSVRRWKAAQWQQGAQALRAPGPPRPGVSQRRIRDCSRNIHESYGLVRLVVC
jgi:transposase